MLAGGWTALLIFYRLLDKPGLQGNERVTATVGVEWGIFIALLLALGVALGGRAHARARTAGSAAAPQARRAAAPPVAPLPDLHAALRTGGPGGDRRDAGPGACARSHVAPDGCACARAANNAPARQLPAGASREVPGGRAAVLRGPAHPLGVAALAF